MTRKRNNWVALLPLGVVGAAALVVAILVRTDPSRGAEPGPTSPKPAMKLAAASSPTSRPDVTAILDRSTPGAAPAGAPAGTSVVNAAGLATGESATIIALQRLDQKYQAEVQPVLVKYCYSCHGNGKHKGDVALNNFASVGALQADRTALTTLADVLHQGSMPPEEKPQPTKAEAMAMGAFFRELMEFRDPSAPRDPGKVTIRRLNRNEYNNTIRDLVGVDFKPAADFPPDDTGYGFDNIADVLSMSPLLAEKYFSSAEQIMDRAIPTGGPPKPKAAHFAGSKLTDSSRGEVLGSAVLLKKFGALSTLHQFPFVADYEIRVRVSEEKEGGDPLKLLVKLDDEVVKTFEIRAPKDKPQVYAARVAVKATGEHKVLVSIVNEGPGKPAAGAAAGGTKPASRRLLVEWVEVEGPFNLPTAPAGPSELQKRLIFVTPTKTVTDEVAAWQNLRKFASRAFRRPVTTDELTRLMKIYAFARKEGEPAKPGAAAASFEFGVKQAMTAVLVSPQFIYRFEPQPAADKSAIYTISDFALATRLSYFLWSSTPDDELATLAEQGKLRSPGVLDAQVKRMLADPKAQSLVTNFAGQWLELRNLDDYEPNKEKFPKFDAKLREAMRKEPELFFANVIREDRSVLELLDSDYSFINGRLAQHYGIQGVSSEDFKKVSLTGTHRGGVLTMAAVMTVTAMPARTSPVKRGKFVLEQILGTPPPPPPPDVPPLDAKKTDSQSASLRQRLEQHRADPVCASCHRRMDPIGFALENFDAIGTWRDKDGNFAIDASGSLPGNVKVDGPDGLRKVLLDRKGDFVRCLCEKLLTYGMGRGIEAADRVMVEEVAAEAAKANYKFSGVILSIVKSDLFQKRRAERE